MWWDVLVEVEVLLVGFCGDVIVFMLILRSSKYTDSDGSLNFQVMIPELLVSFLNASHSS